MKESTKKVQTQRTFQAFKPHPKTMKMVSVETGIDRPNICRYVAKLERLNKITVVKTAPCEITKHKAKYYSTDPDYFPPKSQPELFPTPTHAGAYSQ